MIKSLKENRWLATALILAAIPCIYFGLRMTILNVEQIAPYDETDQAFIDSMMGNWFATTLGLITGIPIGLWINQRQQADIDLQQSKREQQRQQKEQQYRVNQKQKILGLVKKELEYNRNVISDMMKLPSDTRNLVGLKDELWDSLSNGESLQWIDNFDLLYDISDVYYNLKSLKHLERLVLSGSSSRGIHSVVGELRSHIFGMVNKTIAAIDIEIFEHNKGTSS